MPLQTMPTLLADLEREKQNPQQFVDPEVAEDYRKMLSTNIEPVAKEYDRQHRTSHAAKHMNI